MFDPREKVALFIDGPAVYSTARSLEFELDFKKLHQHFSEQAYLLRAYYYSVVPDDEEFHGVRPLLDYLDYNGFHMVTKPVRVFTEDDGRRRFKGSMNIEICVDMLEITTSANHLVLFSGNSDFARVIDAVQHRGVKVSVVSTLRSQSPMIADELRKLADYFIDLDDLRDKVGREFRRTAGGSKNLV